MRFGDVLEFYGKIAGALLCLIGGLFVLMFILNPNAILELSNAVESSKDEVVSEVEIADVSILADVYGEHVDMLKGEFGSDTEVYPSNDGRTYFVVLSDDSRRVATVWGADGNYDFESEPLEEPYTTERQESLYLEFIQARESHFEQLNTGN